MSNTPPRQKWSLGKIFQTRRTVLTRHSSNIFISLFNGEKDWEYIKILGNWDCTENFR